MKEFYKISRDAMFKSIFCKEENWVLLERLIEEVINEKVEIINLSVPELPKDRIYIVFSHKIDTIRKNKIG